MSEESEEFSVEDICKLPLPADKRPYARRMYFSNTSIIDIADTLNIKMPTIKSWVYGYGKSVCGWKVERETARNELLKDLTSSKRGIIHTMVNNSLFLLHDYVEKTKQAVLKTGNPITIKEAEKLTGILTNLHTIIENEKDSPEDDPNFVKPANLEELKTRVIKADVFSKEEGNEDEDIIIDVDFTNVANESESTTKNE